MDFEHVENNHLQDVYPYSVGLSAVPDYTDPCFSTLELARKYALRMSREDRNAVYAVFENNNGDEQCIVFDCRFYKPEE